MDKPKLIWLLKTFHLGKGKAIRKRDLLKELFGADVAADESYNNLHDRELRGAIEEINHDEGGLICSSAADGYWWAESLRDGIKAAEANKSRALTQLHNAEQLVDNIKRQYGGQLGMFEE